MPTYEYECKKCRKTHDISHAMTAKPVTKCPRCGGRLKRLMGGGSGFLFKGSGFYITDYRSKGYQDAKKREESASSAPSSSSASSCKPSGCDKPGCDAKKS